MFLDLHIGLLQMLWDELPHHCPESFALRREGAKNLLEEIENWEPKSVQNEKDKEDRGEEHADA